MEEEKELEETEEEEDEEMPNDFAVKEE